MSGITVNHAAGTATIGAGARLIDVDQALFQHGVTIPAGSCPSVGIAGLTLGGGHGFSGRKYGLTCDNVRSLIIVTAAGQALLASQTQHPDLEDEARHDAELPRTAAAARPVEARTCQARRTKTTSIPNWSIRTSRTTRRTWRGCGSLRLATTRRTCSDFLGALCPLPPEPRPDQVAVREQEAECEQRQRGEAAELAPDCECERRAEGQRQ